MVVISSSVNPNDGFIVTLVCEPVISSQADTLSKPSASTWNVTLILAAPATIGGIPRNSKCARERQSLTISRSP